MRVYLVFYFLMRPISLFCYILYKNLLINIQRINTKNLASFTLLITFLCGPKSIVANMYSDLHSTVYTAGNRNKTFGKVNVHTASDPNQEYIYFM